jgi:hypothetical protein
VASACALIRTRIAIALVHDQRQSASAALPADECERVLPLLDQVTFCLGEVVYESGAN